MALEFLQARLSLITPLFIGGANSRELDDAGVRGASLRAALRFWYRAAAGPALGHDIDALRQAESILFGSAHGPKACRRSTFSLQLGQPWPYPAKTASYPLLPHRATSFRRQAYLPGEVLNVSFVRRSLRFEPSVLELKALAASFWLWVHLGALGNRSRRGAGCFWPQQLIAVNGDIAELPFPGQPSEGVTALAGHLRAGTPIALQWISSHALSVASSGSGSRSNRYFHLANVPYAAPASGGPAPIPGIYLSDHPGAAEDARRELSRRTSVTKRAHSNYGTVMGKANPRLASPVQGRIAPLAGNHHAIVLTVSGSFDSTASAPWATFTSGKSWIRV